MIFFLRKPKKHMKAEVKWKTKVAFTATTESEHTIDMDGSPSYGGTNSGARPMELILSGLGGCASFDVVTILKKSRQDINNVTCQLEAQRADTVPSVFTDINLHFIVEGTDLKEAQVKKAIQLSAEKYCSASKMLQDGGVNITHSHEIIDTGSTISE